LTENKTNGYVIELYEKAFAKKIFTEWEEIFRENEIPYQKAFTVDDVLEDPETYDNDILRKVQYDSYGERVLPTNPIRLKSVGDPNMWISKPIGYDTKAYLQKCGYSSDQIQQFVTEGAVKVYDGDILKFNKLEESSATSKLP
jgi:crotonobetainyl-CoA:carnitine CoA-transferase CaiB-like acyl-CoA transferase